MIKIGSWLENYKNNEHIKDDVFENEDEIGFNVTIPDKYDEELPVIEAPKGHILMSLENIHEYFLDILEDNIRIYCINDADENRIMLVCDYCKVTHSESMYFCKECQKDMCELCYSERTEEIALKNGAKKWQDRKDDLLKCFEHEKNGKFELHQLSFSLNHITCNVCHSSPKSGIWYCNRMKNLDICENCIDTDEGHKLREIGNELQWITKNNEDTFGSLLDWIPLLRDKESGASLMFNINPDSINHHKVALAAMDDHGREGYFIYPGTLTEVIEKINGKISEYEEIKKEKGVSWETHYSSPIHLLLTEFNKPLYYG